MKMVATLERECTEFYTVILILYIIKPLDQQNR